MIKFFRFDKEKKCFVEYMLIEGNYETALKVYLKDQRYQSLVDKILRNRTTRAFNNGGEISKIQNYMIR